MSKRSYAGALAVLVVLLVVPAFQGSSEEERQECSVCGMWIDLYMKTRHVVTHADGRSASFCSIACTAQYLRKSGDDVASVMAADYLSRELVEAEKAYYLSGSDVPGVMAYTSRIAFSLRASAEAFRKEHGGHIIGFKEALKELEE